MGAACPSSESALVRRVEQFDLDGESEDPAVTIVDVQALFVQSS